MYIYILLLLNILIYIHIYILNLTKLLLLNTNISVNKSSRPNILRNKVCEVRPQKILYFGLIMIFVYFDELLNHALLD